MSARRLALWALVGAMLGACPEKQPLAVRGGLKVPLPPGWVADEGQAGVLKAGPRGRPVLLLEHRGEGALPTADELEGALADAGATVVSVQRDEQSVAVRYRVEASGESAQAFIGARRLDGRLFLCASAPEASGPELLVSEGVCRDLKWGGVQ